jgi:hypothetical protein
VWGVAVILFFVLPTAGCKPAGRYEGTYQGKEAGEQVETVVELKENGLGVWRVGDDEMPFRWDAANGEIRLFTRSGGALVGKLGKETFEVQLPGGKTIFLQKTR